MPSALRLKHVSSLTPASIELPGSKSESNRALIINALCSKPREIKNLSEARDTQLMKALLHSDEEVLDVKDAGTTMRFLTAYLAIGKRSKNLKGSKRMHQRPIGDLVDALNEIGAQIKYSKKEGFPPIEIKPFKKQHKDSLEIMANRSSQFISALLMIAPTLPQGLKLSLMGEVGSRPYIQMTLDIMSQFGIEHHWNGNSISISPQTYQPMVYHVESDWSGASYWYSVVALAPKAKIRLLGLKQSSLQGDSVIVSMMNKLGVMTTIEENGVLLEKIASQKSVEFDFVNCPDLAQTIAVVCAAKKIHCRMTGLESLRIKETDRIKALKKELKKLNAKFKETESGVWEIDSKFEAGTAEIVIDTYEDHRMAMAFAPLSVLQNIVIKDADVVNKSYPGFWNDLSKIGIQQELV